jgi:protein-L-isoaspartate O-methyltransferase
VRIFSTSDVLEVYENHPLSLASIVERVRKERGHLEGLTELDLAENEADGITDQNHIGGLPFVAMLADAAGVDSETRVLDVGAGLGGSGRALAHLYGCRVHSVELSPKRCEDARELSHLVRLAGQVTHQCGDFLEVELPDPGYDVVWGQSAWVHFPDKHRLMERAAHALSRGGRIAFEDAFLKRSPEPSEMEPLARLSYVWRAHFGPEQEWLDALNGNGLPVRVREELTEVLAANCSRMLEINGERDEVFPQAELEGWRLGSQLAGAGLLGYIRLVAAR